MKKWPVMATVLMLLLGGGACSPGERPPLEQIQDAGARAVLSRALEAAGGWENWQALQTIAYRKRTVLYDSLGKVESDRTQWHRYRLRPVLEMHIGWREGTDSLEIVLQDGQVRRYRNGRPEEAPPETLQSTLSSALYTLFMPFKLLDPGTRLRYLGRDTLPDGREAEVLAAHYDPTQHPNHSTAEPWRYYFDPQSGAFLAAWVDHGDYRALILNESYAEFKGLRFNALRRSWRLDAHDQPAWMRGLFEYAFLP